MLHQTKKDYCVRDDRVCPGLHYGRRGCKHGSVLKKKIVNHNCVPDIMVVVGVNTVESYD
jgi:hypothetical protein